MILTSEWLKIMNPNKKGVYLFTWSTNRHIQNNLPQRHHARQSLVCYRKKKFYFLGTHDLFLWLHSIMDSMDMNLGKLQEIMRGRGAWWAAVHVVAKSRTQLSDWTTTTNWAPVSVFLHCAAPHAYPCHQQAETCTILFSNNDSVWPMWTSPPIHIYIGFCLARLCVFFMTGEHSGHYE